MVRLSLQNFYINEGLNCHIGAWKNICYPLDGKICIMDIVEYGFNNNKL
jgi:hypothetical protein